MDFNTASERAELRKALARPARLEIAGQLLIGTTCVTGIPDVVETPVPRSVTVTAPVGETETSGSLAIADCEYGKVATP